MPKGKTVKAVFPKKRSKAMAVHSLKNQIKQKLIKLERSKADCHLSSDL